MYQQFKNEVLGKLSKLDADTLSAVSKAMDRAAMHYEFQQKALGLTVRGADGLPDPVKFYLVSRKMEGLSARTLKIYKFYLDKFFDSVHTPLNKITTNEIRVFLFSYQDQHQISNRTLDTMRSVISACFAWLASEEYIPSDPCTTIKVIKYEAKHRPALTQMELEQIRQACQNEKESAIVEFLYSTGCRASEAVGARLSDIDWGNAEVVVLGKGNKHRKVFFNAKCVISLQAYLKTRKDKTDAIFVSDKAPHNRLTVSGLEFIIAEIAKRCPNIQKKVSPHVFRHTTATAAIQSGMKVQDIQAMLGHTQINTTMIYAEVSTEDVKLSHRKYIV